MVAIRPFRPEELSVIVARGVQTMTGSLVARQRPTATHDAVAGQLVRMYQTTLATPESALFVADWPGLGSEGPAGHILLLRQWDSFTGAPELVVMDIWTHPALRGRGVGRAMLAHAERYGRSIGCRGILAQVAVHNHPSLSMFLKGGFQSERYVVGKGL